ncbi:MAG: radical SAM protein [Acidimicrobiia bacterium]|nr:radical SAM protein [Acidimicrobiia bacterium]
MRVLLLSTYELGRQPVHLASPAAALSAAGHVVRMTDLSVDAMSDSDVDWADAVAISVPMHTATRLAITVLDRIRERRPEIPTAAYGLYAGQLAGRVDATLEGEYEPGLSAWIDGTVRGHVRHIGKSQFIVPKRDELPALDSYARLDLGDEMVLAGAVEASHGCRHRCRHCPIPAVYDGRIRVVPSEVVLDDIDRLTAGGARHITFGDADFLNAPKHTIGVLEEAHSRHPEITFDVTVKVSHILDHSEVWDQLAGQGLLFVVSAFESVDDETLEILDKGHTVGDMVEALDITRAAGIYLRPSWLPFLPWTTSDHVRELFRFIAQHDLAAVTDPVQLAIKLLIPKGSLLESHPAVTPYLRGYDEDGLTWQWAFADPESERLSKELEAIAAAGSDCGELTHETFASMWRAVEAITAANLGSVPEAGDPAPRLTESWFCCAEPTASQSLSIGSRQG